MTREREDFFEHLRKPLPPRRGGISRAHQTKALKAEVAAVGHRTGLPGKLLELFQPRPELKPGADVKKRPPKLPILGVAGLVERFASAGEAEYEPPRPSNRPASPRLCRNPELPLQTRIDTETAAEKKIRITQWKKEEALTQVEAAAKQWEPSKDPKIPGDPYKTLFISRLSYDVNDKKLRKEFEEFGPIRNLQIILDKAGKSRGYAFVEYEHKTDMKNAYKQADGRKIEGRRVVVDVERGRTVENWRPRRLAGGLGGQGREPKLPKKQMMMAGGALGLPSALGPPRDAPLDDRRGPSREDYRGPSSSRPDDRARSPPRGGDRDRGGAGDRDRDRKREREPSPRRRREDESKRYRPEDERRRERDML